MAALLGLTTAAAGALLLVWLCRRYPYVSTVLVVAFAVRLAAAAVHAWLVPLPYGTADAVTFEQVAWEWGQDGFVAAASHFNPASSYMYSWAAAMLYAVTERSRLMLQALNVIGGTLIVLNSYLIARSLWGDRRAYTVAWFVALFPFLIQISAVTHREVAIVFFLTLGVYVCIGWVESGRPRELVLGLFLLAVSAVFHGGMSVALVGAMCGLVVVGTWLLLRRLSAGRMRTGTAIGVVALLTVAGIVAWMGVPEMSRVGVITQVDPEVVRSLTEARAREEAVYLEGVFPRTATDLIVQSPVRVAYFLFSPFPWQVESASHLIALADVVLYVLLFWGLWRSRHRILDDRRAAFILAVTLMTVAAFALVTSNFGTALRHRAKFVPLLAALWATPVLHRRLVIVRGDPDDGGRDEA